MMMMIVWEIASLLFVAVAHGRKEDACLYVEMQGEHEDCRGIWKAVSVHAFVKESFTSSKAWVNPDPGKQIAYRHIVARSRGLDCYAGLDKTELLEREVLSLCAGFSHMVSYDKNVMDGSNDMHCQAVVVTNFDTDVEELWGFYFQRWWNMGDMIQKFDQWGQPATGQLYIYDFDQYGIRVNGFNKDQVKLDSFFIHRKRCQGNKVPESSTPVYSDREEHDNSEHYPYTCWTLKVIGGECGTGTWTRMLIDDQPDQWWYRKWTPTRLAESDLYQNVDWKTDNRIYWHVDLRKYVCDGKAFLTHAQVECSGATALWFVDRPWPSRYVAWVNESGAYTTDRFRSCKMFRMLKAYGHFQQGYYVQAAFEGEYFNIDTSVSLELHNGKWAARTKCSLNEHGIMHCEGDYESEMDPYDPRWTCVSADSYCGYITVTTDDTPAGPCQGRYRLWRNNVYARFDQETHTQNQEIVDRMLGNHNVRLEILSSSNERIGVRCYVELEPNFSRGIPFSVPRSRCFTHGTFNWDIVDYPSPFQAT